MCAGNFPLEHMQDSHSGFAESGGWKNGGPKNNSQYAVIANYQKLEGRGSNFWNIQL